MPARQARGPAASAAERLSDVSAKIALGGFEPPLANPSPGASRHPLPQGERDYPPRNLRTALNASDFARF
jgi:hypothetical protein